MASEPLTELELTLRAAELNMTAQLALITDAEVAALKATLGAMLDGKVAYFRDHDDAAARRASDAAKDHLMAAGVPGAVLFGDLGTGITNARISALFAALQASA